VQLSGQRFVVGIAMMLALGMAAGCHTPEEKALATERVELLGMQASLATKFTECRTLDSALRELKKTTGARIESSNTQWNALSKSKRDSLMKPHSKETGPYFKAMIAPLIRCGTVFPVK
jgi:hypothetical protein